ncbi:Thioredoxin-like protein AAED1 [Hibiscus syriacus]|uniref:Thioredoxin-like protein AAED1 n=1 Tax=Hibiscus syriacus TaxID=106335 RepID=A0A6A3AN10_HIBSY|nr:Thioredoxin-like protein AAED1 [Hibiscus syriacus]
MNKCNSVYNPIVLGCKLTKDENGVRVDGRRYKQLINNLMYLTTSRPNMMYAVSLLSRYMEHPTELHFQAAKRVLRCIKGTLGFDIFYKKGGNAELIVYTDNDYARGLESSAVSEDTVDLLDTVKVFDLNGNEIPISDLWKDRKAVVAFARHFGCVFCRKRADYLAFKKDVMDKAGAALVLIGPGSIEQASARDYICLKIIQLYMEGYRQDWKLSFEEDTVKRGGWRQGGILVAGPGKKNILYVHKDKEAGDDPEIEDILKACRS